jgi:YcaO-like protein with predicted kinase domain
LSAVAELEPLEAAKRYRLGTHRTCGPQETLARVRPWLGNMGITRVANVTGLDRTGIPVVMVCRPNSRSVTVSQGKGITLDAAKASGVMEAVEAWHAERVMRPLMLASFEEMRSTQRVVDVAALPQAADSRFTAELPLLWIEGQDLLGGQPAWVPYELVSANYTLPLPPGSGCFQANTNGLASGNHWLEAASHALCELVERDANTLWKHRPQEQAHRVLDPGSVDDPDCVEVLARLADAGLRARIWDTTSDVGIASFVCLLVGPEEDKADPEFGAGCHPDRHIALLRALTEAAQARTTFIAGARDDYFAHLYGAPERGRRRALCERLLEPPAQERRFTDVPTFESPSLEGDLRWILARLRSAGLAQAVAVDLSRESIGIPVVRMIVPGLEGVMDEEHGDYSPGRRARRYLQEAA